MLRWNWHPAATTKVSLNERVNRLFTASVVDWHWHSQSVTAFVWGTVDQVYGGIGPSVRWIPKTSWLGLHGQAPRFSSATWALWRQPREVEHKAGPKKKAANQPQGRVQSGLLLLAWSQE